MEHPQQLLSAIQSKGPSVRVLGNKAKTPEFSSIVLITVNAENIVTAKSHREGYFHSGIFNHRNTKDYNSES